MFLSRFVRIVIFTSFFTLLIGSSVLADDGRINRAPYHFGGDTLFCTQEDGCKLLNLHGHELATWSQDAVATALSKADQTNQKLLVGGEGKGTYGPMQLWAMAGQTQDGDSTLCMVGFDEWGKQNDMCFPVTKDWHFEQAPLPVAGADHSCDRWAVGDRVQLIADHSKDGEINSIDRTNYTVDFGKDHIIAKCSEIEPGPV